MKYTWLVEKYIEGELTGEELSDFELLILKDPAVAEELDRIRELHRFSREQHLKLREHSGLRLVEESVPMPELIPEEELLDDLNELKIRKIGDRIRTDHIPGTGNNKDTEDLISKIRSSFTPEAPAKGVRQIRSLIRYNLWLTAASLALVLAVSVILLIHTRPANDPLALYEAHFQPYRPDLTARTHDPGQEHTYQAGLDAYMNAEYSRALELFRESLVEGNAADAVFLFTGISQMALGDHQAAIATLEHLRGKYGLEEYRLWYSGLCYLKLNQPDRARLHFSVLSKENGYYSARAKSILRSL